MGKKKKTAHLYSVAYFPVAVMNMPQTRDCLELAIDMEDSRTGYMPSMWYECAERKNLKEKKRKERLAGAARNYSATDCTPRSPR